MNKGELVERLIGLRDDLRKRGEWDACDLLADACNFIDKMPKEKLAHWEEPEVTCEIMEELGCRYDARVFRCSNCHNTEMSASSYCRTCGAKMEWGK